MAVDFKTMTNVERHRVSHDYWNRHDFDTFSVIFTPVIDYTEHERDIHVTSVAEMKEFATSVWTAFPDLQITEQQYFDAGNGWTVCKFTLRGTNDGPFLGRPATGKQVAIDACEWAHWNAEGQAVGGDTYPSFLALLRQLGVRMASVLVCPARFPCSPSSSLSHQPFPRRTARSMRYSSVTARLTTCCCATCSCATCSVVP